MAQPRLPSAGRLGCPHRRPAVEGLTQHRQAGQYDQRRPVPEREGHAEDDRRAEVRGALERHLRHEPTRVSKSRIKRLRGLSQPQYRLRVGEVRVFYDVTREVVEVLAIVTKAEAARWLAEHGTPGAPGGTR